MRTHIKKRPIVAGSLFILGLLLIINPEISRGVISLSSHTSDVSRFENDCALPSIPAKLSDNNNRPNRNNCIDRKTEQTSKDITYFVIHNLFNQTHDYVSNHCFSTNNRYLISFQQTCQLLDIPPPSC